MTYKGIVTKGKMVLLEGVQLPEGTVVTVTVQEVTQQAKEAAIKAAQEFKAQLLAKRGDDPCWVRPLTSFGKHEKSGLSSFKGNIFSEVKVR